MSIKRLTKRQLESLGFNVYVSSKKGASCTVLIVFKENGIQYESVWGQFPTMGFLLSDFSRRAVNDALKQQREATIQRISELLY